jgi:uncharacterized MAPEG superfamily protein
MTSELTYLAFTALLAASLWIVYVAAQVQANGLPAAPDYTDPTPRPVPFWGMRANRAHLNLVEAFAPFAVLVLILHVTNQNNSTTAFLCMSFFWLRVVHAIVYWLALPYVRTIVFTLGYLCVLGLFWQVVT